MPEIENNKPPIEVTEGREGVAQKPREETPVRGKTPEELRQDIDVIHEQITAVKKSNEATARELDALRSGLDLPSEIETPSSIRINEGRVGELEDKRGEKEGALAEEEKRWYEMAREKAESFLHKIDPNLRVSIERAVVTPFNPERREYDYGKNYETYSLKFTHLVEPDLRWSMEIGKSEDYIENRLEGVVRNIYAKEERLKEFSSSTKEWCLETESIVASVVQKLDPELRVDFDSVAVASTGEFEEFEEKMLILKFTHKTNPSIAWRMEIPRRDDYLEENFEGVMAKIYQEKKKAAAKLA